MSPIGKIFTVLNVVLAAIFLGFASSSLSSHQSWKEKHATLQGEMDKAVADLTQEKAKIAEERKQVEQSNAQLRLDLERVQGALGVAESSLKTERDKATENTANLQKIQATLADYAATNASLQQRMEGASTAENAAKEAQRTAEDEREAALAAQRDAESKLAAATKDVAQLEKDLEAQRQEAQGLETSLAALVDTTGVSLDEITSMPLIQGAVLQVVGDMEPGLVAINKGTADGVKRGYTFEIFNGRTYKGMVRVESVRENMCTAVIIRNVAGTTINQGDGAATRI